MIEPARIVMPITQVHPTSRRVHPSTDRLTRHALPRAVLVPTIGWVGPPAAAAVHRSSKHLTSVPKIPG
jgi:hypothetical protein